MLVVDELMIQGRSNIHPVERVVGCHPSYSDGVHMSHHKVNPSSSHAAAVGGAGDVAYRDQVVEHDAVHGDAQEGK